MFIAPIWGMLSALRKLPPPSKSLQIVVFFLKRRADQDYKVLSGSRNGKDELTRVASPFLLSHSGFRALST